jgi:hypothetical protein
LNGHSHPQNAALDLGPDFVRLHLAQVVRLLHQILVYLVAVRPCAFFQALDRTLIHSEGGDNGLARTTMHQQGDDLHEGILGQTLPVEDSALGGGKGTAADLADVRAILAAVYPDIAFVDVSPCGAGRIGAEYGLWVHWFTLLVGLETEPDCANGPCLVKLRLYHGWMQSYPITTPLR